MSLLEIVPVRLSLIGNSPIRNPARDPNLEGAHRSAGREGESKAIAALPPCLPQILDRFLFPPSFPSPSLRPLSAFPLPPFSLHSSFPLFQMSTRRESKSALLMLSGMTGRKVRECLLAPFLHLELHATIFFKPAGCVSVLTSS